jgi:protein-S-isoprenylcysteine O-methyltransferase Ste14
MFTLYFVLIGLVVFACGVAILGTWLRMNPSKANAEKSSRIMHFLFFAGMVTPPRLGLFYPGLTHFDELVGLKPLPWKPFFFVLGILLAVPGFYFMIVTNKLLRALGSGANAFRLTKTIVAEDVYKRTRNPMSLGFYLLTLATGFVSGSTLAVLFAILGFIPFHLFFLKYFEELELELRFGESYLEYKKTVPFLIPKFR